MFPHEVKMHPSTLHIILIALSIQHSLQDRCMVREVVRAGSNVVHLSFSAFRDSCTLVLSSNHHCNYEPASQVLSLPSSRDEMSLYYWSEKELRNEVFCSDSHKPYKQFHDQAPFMAIPSPQGYTPIVLKSISVEIFSETYPSSFHQKQWFFPFSEKYPLLIKGILGADSSSKTVEIKRGNQNISSQTFSQDSFSIEMELNSPDTNGVVQLELKISNAWHSITQLLLFKKAYLHRIENTIRVEVTEGSVAVLRCRQPQAFPVSLTGSTSWNVERNKLPSVVKLSDHVVRTIDGHLAIFDVKSSDAGLYTCDVRNLQHTYLESPNLLVVQSSSSPRNDYFEEVFKSSGETLEVEAVKGDSTQLYCIFDGRPTPSIEWRILKSTDSSGVYAPINHGHYSMQHMILSLQNISFSDAALYRCQASNKAGNATRLFKVVVFEKASFINEMVAQKTSEGNDVTFECSFKGTPAVQVTWSLDGRPLPQFSAVQSKRGDRDYEIEVSKEGSRLLMKKVHTSVTVGCRVENHLSQVQQQAPLIVYRKVRMTDASKMTQHLSHDNKTTLAVVQVAFQADERRPLNLSWIFNNKSIDFIDLETSNDLHLKSSCANYFNQPRSTKAFFDGSLLFCLNKQLLNTLKIAVISPIPNIFVTSLLSDGFSRDSRNFRLQLPVTKASLFSFSKLWQPWGILLILVLIMLFISVIIIVKMCSKKKATISKEDSLSPKQLKTPFNDRKPNGSWSENLKQTMTALHVERDNIELIRCIGNGHFGRVYFARLKRNNHAPEIVAVKTMKYRAEEKEMVELFLKEATLMKDFQHKNVLGIKGISFEHDLTPMVVLPYMANGDLRNYILNPNLNITILNLLTMGAQVALGMEYLASCHFVHRDLAARNCMINEAGVVKIADFGMSRHVFEYYRVENGKDPVPIRWMAPECIEAKIFTTKSDVWAYGVLLWELLTRGAVPYEEAENWQVVLYIQKRMLLPQPALCPDVVHELMLSCWSEDPKNRPPFTDIVTSLHSVLNMASKQNIKSSSTSGRASKGRSDARSKTGSRTSSRTRKKRPSETEPYDGDEEEDEVFVGGSAFMYFNVHHPGTL